MQLELSTTADGRPGVVVLGGHSRTAVVPTTEELSSFVLQPEALEKIQKVRQNALQQADEKVAIAEQTYSLVDATVRRLDNDLATLEKYVKIPCFSFQVCPFFITHSVSLNGPCADI